MALPALGMAIEDRDRMGGVPRGKGSKCPRQVWEVQAVSKALSPFIVHL